MATKKLKLLFSGLVTLLLIVFYFVFVTKVGSVLLLVLESLGLLFLAVLAFVGFALYKNKTGDWLLFTTATLSIINLILLWHFSNVYSFTLVILSLLLLLLNFPCGCCSSCKDDVCDLPPPEPVVPEPKKEVSVSKKAAFVASSRSKLYHSPKCDWAKKINPRGKLKFNSKEEAWEKGYRAHDCAQ